MPEIAGGAAVLTVPQNPKSIAAGILEACGPRADQLRELGLRRARTFTWGATAEATLNVYREVAERRQRRRAR
jgi:glycosyltransferase involved in cell wall biosynthesis